jgi:hypothetical protein
MRLLALGLLLLACQACILRQPGSDPIAFSFHTTPQADELRRVVVIPLYRGPEVGESAGRLDEALATSLRETSRYEVAVLDQERRDHFFPRPDLGLDNLDPDHLRHFRDQTGADAILVGRVDHFDSYDPIAVGLEVHLISCRDGSTAWSANGHFDGRRDDIRRDIQKWHSLTMGRRSNTHTIGGWETTLQSPLLFSRYVADRLCATLLLGP